MKKLENNIEELSGFKISNSHFKIGSKIHISDFYYAKRFFQNGFFSSRIAFLLTKDIIKIIEDENKLSDVKNNGLTIIGYEMYSELLISMVDKFLRIKWQLNESKINHNLYEDFENLSLSKKSNIFGNVVIIVPIASTFSTSIKIENQLIKDQIDNDKDVPYIFSPHFNVLYVSDGIPSNTITKLEESFSWKKKNINNKLIEVGAIYSDNAEINRMQKFYLTLSSKWHNVEDCQLCNPALIVSNIESERLQDELPLYETDRTSVTPAIIFDFPKGRIIEDDDLNRKIILDAEAVNYGHHKRDNAHFLYSINTELFLEKNLYLIQEWLLKIKNSVAFKDIYKEIDRVIIISSCHFSNAAFITMVNDFLFASSANIIHIDPTNDYVQNFKIVYGQEMNDADKIFFVDDSLKSGAAFDKIYQFVQNTLESSVDERLIKGITGCFFLFNKSQPYTFKNLKTKLLDTKHIYAFANLHLYTSLKPFEISPLQIEEERYKGLVSSSFIDSLKVHFIKQKNKLTLSSKIFKEKIINEKSQRHLEMLIATHRTYQYFTIESKPILVSFYDFINDLFQKTQSPIDSKKHLPLLINNYLDTEGTKAYLKILTHPPFTQYKSLKDHVFKWIIQLLINQINDSEQAIKEGSFTYDLFDKLKFFIRRAGLLNSNILISKTFIEFLPILYSSNGIPKVVEVLISEIEEKKRDPNSILASNIFELEDRVFKLKDFHIFYAAQIKELLVRNESRCLRVENILKFIDKGTNPYVKQIVRILREENSLIIKVFYEYISHQEGWNKIYSLNSDVSSKEVIDSTNDKIINFLNKASIFRHHKFQTLNSYFDITNQCVITENKNLLNYLWLQYFLSTDKHKKISLIFKTELIISKLMQMFIHSGITEIGAFFIVNDSQRNPFLAFNKNYNGITEIDDFNFKSEENKYLNKFFEGEDNSFKKEHKHYKTLIELKRNSYGEWIDLFTTSGSTIIHELSKDFVAKEYNRILLIRLNKRLNDKKNDKTQGVIGFYYNSKSEEIVDINILKYILLLRPSLSRFIETHHENDEFRDWQIAEIKQKTSLLTGHGREMLIKLARTKGDEYKDIVYTLLLTQRFLIDKKEEAANSGIKSELIKKMFKDFYQKTGVINNVFFDDLKKMANNIFEFEEIENKEELAEPEMKIQENLLFKFDKKLLRMICFELLVNAKKNRWLFSESVKSNFSEDVFEKNKIWLDAKMDNSKLLIVISNTGPKITPKVLEKLNTKRNIKRYDNSSGIELIDTLLTEFDLGDIRFEQEDITDEMSKFKVILSLIQNIND